MLTDLTGSAFGRRSGRLLEFLGRIRFLVGLGRREVGFVLVLERSRWVGLRQRGYPLGPPRLLGFLVSLTSRRLASISTDWAKGTTKHLLYRASIDSVRSVL